MEHKQILAVSDSSIIFAYLALRCSNARFNHLAQCLKIENLLWEEFLQLTPETRIKRFPFLPGESYKKLTQALKQPEPIYQLLQRMQREGISVLLKDERRYPSRLREELGANAPPLLFYRGNPDCLERKQVAIVGTRRASPAGLNATKNYATLLAKQGINIISGGAQGIDLAAQLAALRAGGTTIMVIPQGLLTYRLPDILESVFDDKRATILSVFSPDEPFQKRYAVFRNSVVAAIADAVLVPETPLRSGTAYVIKHILAHQRPLFTIIYPEPVPESAIGNRTLLSFGAVALPPQISSADGTIKKFLQVRRK